VPCGFTREGLPVGLHIVAKALAETDILRAAAAFEAAHPWTDKTPPLAKPHGVLPHAEIAAGR
jgi:aspartyl-tRNA(Asn)/glutamyl-tRNA(Gln) amidotransferase subunit A